MSEIQWTIYLDWLWSGRDRTDVVKVITGMRRSSKTVLSLDSFPLQVSDGIGHYNVMDWLLGTVG